MNLEQYQFSASPGFLDFHFISAGPRGKIMKGVRFSPVNANGITYFNLAFGDLVEGTLEIDDLAISNNNDRDKILATVACIVLEFTSHYKDAIIYAKGSTASRTRLYQMGILANWNQVNSVIQVQGFYKGTWQPFEKNINYTSFLFKRKTRNFISNTDIDVKGNH